MADASFQTMVIVFLAGLGGLMIGGLNVLMRRRSLSQRALAFLAPVGLMGAGAFAFTSELQVASEIALFVAGLGAAVLLLGSDWLAARVSFAARCIRHPALLGGTVSLLGLLIGVGSVAWWEHSFELDTERQTDELTQLSIPPPTNTPLVRATTDLGNPVAIREASTPRSEDDLLGIEMAVLRNDAIRDHLIRCEPASDRANCHGWVFTGGRFWIGGTEVDRILTDNQYQAVTSPRPGDIVVYRSSETVSHTGIVRYVTDGLPVLVEGKWGCTGVYLHPVDKSIYGTDFTYYRSPRPGHLLAGIGSPAIAPVSTAPHVMPDPANPDEFTE